MFCNYTIESVCVVLAKIMDFDTNKGWYYETCSKCGGKVSHQIRKLYYCDNCANMVPSKR